MGGVEKVIKLVIQTDEILKLMITTLRFWTPEATISLCWTYTTSPCHETDRRREIWGGSLNTSYSSWPPHPPDQTRPDHFWIYARALVTPVASRAVADNVYIYILYIWSLQKDMYHQTQINIQVFRFKFSVMKGIRMARGPPKRSTVTGGTSSVFASRTSQNRNQNWAGDKALG